MKPIHCASYHEDDPFAIHDHPHDECGVFGVYAPGEDVARIAFFGLFALQHRGQESAGIAVSDGNQLTHRKDSGLVSMVFDETQLSEMVGNMAVGHTRYSTTGSSVARNAQPVICEGARGGIAVAHNGNLVNTLSLRRRMESEGEIFLTTNDSELMAKIFTRWFDETGDPLEAVRRMMDEVTGAYSLVVMGPGFLLGCRDPHGLRPLCVGRSNGHTMIASETCALNVVGAKFDREVQPGEVVLVTSDGVTYHQGAEPVRQALCLFEFIYFARPDTRIYGRSLHAVRRAFGAELAREHPVPEADVVIPIPDTGIPAALGFAHASGIPYAEGLIKNRYIHRTFIQPNQRMREMGVRIKLNPLKDVIEGKRIVMVDDSIVRGTTTGKLVKMLLEAGAREVHVRITSPPVRYPCYYGIDMATREELVAGSVSVGDIRAMIGAASLGYLSIQGMSRAIGFGKDRFCMACFDGDYPIPIPEEALDSKMALETDFCGSPEAMEPVP